MARTVTGSNNDTIFLKITDGKVRESYNVDQNSPGAISRLVENKQTKQTTEVWEKVYDDISGVITKIEIKYEERLKSEVMEIYMYDEDENEKVKISLLAKSRYAQDFINKGLNADFTKYCKLRPYKFNKDNKDIIGMNIFQMDGLTEKKIFPRYSKENPGGPDYNKYVSEGKKDYWSLDYYKFLIEHFNKDILPTIVEPVQAASTVSQSTEAKENIPISDIAPPEETDDLPF